MFVWISGILDTIVWTGQLSLVRSYWPLGFLARPLVPRCYKTVASTSVHLRLGDRAVSGSSGIGPTIGNIGVG